MRDNEGKKRKRKRPGEAGPDDSLDTLLSSYTPRQREKVLKGLRILARVAIRSYMERRWPASTTPPDGEEEGQEGTVDE